MHHIYIHIPFCLKKCAYCGFYSVTDLSLVDRYIDALIEEIRGDTLLSFPRKRESIKTIYLGGGTPSILSVQQLEKITESLSSSFTIEKNCEFSIEANPETVSKDRLIGFKRAGVNRISIGVQSFDDDVLKYLGRVHTSDSSRRAISAALEIFENAGIDLMFGMPRQQISAIEKDIREALKFPLKHISCYELTLEEGTPLFKDAGKRKEDDGEGYILVKTLLEAGGFLQYEISNYSLPGYQSSHNLAYWSNESYLGLGPSAHSFDKGGVKRWANRPDIESYLNGVPLDFVEDAQDIDRLIMGLRKTDGMKTSEIPIRYKGAVSKLVHDSLLESKSDAIAFTKRGVLLSNRILLEIMQKSEEYLVA